METPADLLQRAPEEAAALLARGLLAHARAAADRLDDPEDAEALHDFRVAIRRLRSTLRAWQPELAGVSRKRRRQLRKLQRTTGSGRDAEVALARLAVEADTLDPEERPGLDHLVGLLEERHRAARVDALVQLRAGFDAIEKKLGRELARVRIERNLARPEDSPCFGPTLAARARAAADAVAPRLSAIHDYEDRTEVHAARIAGKRLRYLVEPLGEAAASCVALCKDLQDQLGDLHDAHILFEEIRDCDGTAPAEARSGLAALAARVDAAGRQQFAELSGSWLADLGAGLRQEVESFARHCEDAARPAIEIERKYLLSHPPDLDAVRARGLAVESLEIEQGWLPGQRLRERVRRTRRADGSVEYRRTVKLGAGVQRIEIEEETSEAVFAALWPLTEGCRVRKRRHRVSEAGLVWEIDDFLDRPLFLAEVELSDPEMRPEPPPWLDVQREVTEDPAYTNLALAR